MTREEAIKILEAWAKCSYKPTHDAAELAISALRAQQDTPNDPLTLEDLREMDGEPVWNDTMKQWAIVDTHDRRTINVCGRWRPLSDRYYRRKPEEGTA